MLDGERKIWDFICEDFLAGRTDGFDRNTSLLETGAIDSMGLFRLISFIEEAFTVRVSEEDLIADNFQSFERIMKYIESKVPREPRTGPLG